MDVILSDGLAVLDAHIDGFGETIPISRRRFL
jgi:hypothetical protein